MKNNDTIENLFGEKEGEIFYIENKDRKVNLGRLAIRLEYLGINDPLSHLFQYLESGEKSIASIKEDLETDIAERLPDTPFISKVMFDFAEDDFISSIGKVSMRVMTRNNLNILAEASSSVDGDLTKERERALIEAKEPEKLKQWLLGAKTGAFLIFESLPIGEQEIAVSRIYRKVDDTTVEGSFVSFYQPSVKHFNELRRQIGAGNDDCKTEAEVLSNSYEFFSSTFKDSDNFIEYYRYIYDQILRRNNGDETYFFGLSSNDFKMKPKNGLDIIQKQTTLTEVYFEALRILANCDGKVNKEAINLAKNLNLNLQLNHGETVSMDIAREYLGQIIRGIARVIHQADEGILTDISSLSTDKLSSHAAISYYSVSQQSTIMHDYANNVCPTYNRDSLYNANGEAVASEYNTLTRSFNIHKHIDNFGTPRVGVCIISGCPSRGNIEWLPSRTIVGGCSICVSCHKILNAGKSPEKIYLKEKSKQVKKSLSRSL